MVINQGPDETITHYYKRFLATTSVIEAQWGDFVPTHLFKSECKGNLTAARDSMLDMIFLAGADKRRFGKLHNDLNNSYLAKKDNYPRSLDATLTLLSHFQDHRDAGGRTVKVTNVGEGGGEASFMQSGRRSTIKCFLCKQPGHVKRDCPSLGMPVNNNQMEDTTGGRTDSVVSAPQPRGRCGWSD